MIKLDKRLVKGLYNWYPFEKDAIILYFMSGEEMHETSEYSDYTADYIVASGVIEISKDPVALLKEFKRILKPDGHLLLGCQNRMGLRYFCGSREPYSGNCFDGIENYSNYLNNDWNNMAGRQYALYEINEMLDKAGLVRRRRLSVLPGLEAPQIFCAEDFVPDKDMIQIGVECHDAKTSFLSESRLYESVIRNGMFHQMADAYLFDCSQSGDFYEVNYVKDTFSRGHGAALATIIEKSGYVIKRSLHSDANHLIESLVRNSKNISEHGVKVIPVEKISLNDGCIGVRMPYVECESAVSYIRRLFYSDREEFVRKVQRFLELILKSSEPCEKQLSDNKWDVLYNVVYTDMLPINCLYDGSDFIFYDQDSLECNSLIYQQIVKALIRIYNYDKGMEAELPMRTFIEPYGIEDKFDEFAKQIKDKDERIWHVYNTVDVGMKQYLNRQNINNMNCFCDESVSQTCDGDKKDVYLFGSGLYARRFVDEYADRCNISAMVDNNSDKWGEVVGGVRVLAPDILRNLDKDSTRVVICVHDYATIPTQLHSMGINDFSVYNPYLRQ